ncbi:hypothetical protein DM860_005586 [Cuscuta australis]|uniref:ACT domain-containing protein ACR n=1 Tax=Cuscuta australis TaxID=267555 RepID=A0A328DR78_9ASTE|nr:hypothetical protein DM860_005586 [Cuscuta australis]
MKEYCSPYFDPEYETLSIRINPPRVSVDNISCKDCTVVKVDSVNKPGILLEVVQILSDFDLIITKAYVSSDGQWFMDVFHVTDQYGNKVTDCNTIGCIEKALGPKGYTSGVLRTWPGENAGTNYTAIELIGRDRPGLLSEISAVLADLHFNVAAAEVWTHNQRTACILYVNIDKATDDDDRSRLSVIEERLRNILLLAGEDDDTKNVAHTTSVFVGRTHLDRRLHQMFFADHRDCDEDDLVVNPYSPLFKPKVAIDHCAEKDYWVVTVRCKDRPKLMFDIVCTLTDMHFVVFHAAVSSDAPYASQEYYIRHMDGCTLQTEKEKERVVKCLEAAIQRRVSEGLRLELSANDRVGLLSDVTRILRENGLIVTRAGISTVGEQGINVFYIRDSDSSGNLATVVERLRQEFGQRMMMLEVKKVPSLCAKAPEIAPRGGWARSRFLLLGGFLAKFLSIKVCE